MSRKTIDAEYIDMRSHSRECVSVI